MDTTKVLGLHATGEASAEDDVNSAYVSSDHVAVVSSPDPAMYAWEVIPLTAYAVLGAALNSLVIYLFTRESSSYSGNVFIITLAVLDIVVCDFMALLDPVTGTVWPQPSTLRTNAVQSFNIALMMSYLCVLTSMSLERLTAVVKPITYRKTKHWHKYVVIGIVAANFVITTNYHFWIRHVTSDTTREILHHFMLFVILSSFIIILASYTLIVKELRKQQQKVVAVDLRSAQSTITGGFSSKSTRARHIGMLKIFIAVSILFVASYVPLALAVSGALSLPKQYKKTPKYAYMINHIGNPLIYYTLNKTFRADTNDLVRGLFVKIQNWMRGRSRRNTRSYFP